MDQIRDLAKERGKKIVNDDFGMPISGGIGNGVNDGGPSYCVDTHTDTYGQE